MNIKDVIVAYKTGSQLWANNTKDVDYLVVVKDEAYKDPVIRQDGNEYFIMKESEFKKFLNGDHPKSYYAIVCSQEPIFGSYDVKPDYLSIKSKVIEKTLQAFYMAPYISAPGGKYCHKHIAWAIWLIYAIEHNSTEITDELKKMLQQAHDLKLPKSVQDEVRNKLLQLNS